MGETTAVLYQADCPDGFGAAIAPWRALGDTASYNPVRHGASRPDRGRDRAGAAFRNPYNSHRAC
jgi:hypothetical protein